MYDEKYEVAKINMNKNLVINSIRRSEKSRSIIEKLSNVQLILTENERDIKVIIPLQENHLLNCLDKLEQKTKLHLACSSDTKRSLTIDSSNSNFIAQNLIQIRSHYSHYITSKFYIS